MKSSMKKTLGVVTAFILLLAGVKACQISRAIAANSNHTPPPEAVTSIVAERLTWPSVVESVGSLVPERGAILSVEEPGTVAKVLFESGAAVAKGAVLIELDLSVEEANLAGARARKERAQKDLERNVQLRANKTVSAQALDLAESDAREADASVKAIEATIARKRVIAPFAGITGIRSVNVGDYLTPGAKVISLQSFDPIYANFSVPQKLVQEVRVGQKIEVKIDAYPGKTFTGTLNAFDPQIDSLTRNVLVQASLPNPEGLLRPGMFVDVRLELDGKQEFVALPSTAISYAPYGDAVYIIDTVKGKDGSEVKSVRQQVVKTGPTRGDQIAILEGVEVGQEIATSGLFKLRPGSVVTIHNNLAPSNEIAPQPSDS